MAGKKYLIIFGLLAFCAIPKISQAADDTIWVLETGAEATIVSVLEDAGYSPVEKSQTYIKANGIPNSVDLFVYPGSVNAIVQSLDSTLKSRIQTYVNNGGSILGSCGGAAIMGQNLTYNFGTTTMLGLAQVNAYDYLQWPTAGYSGNYVFSSSSLNGDYAGTMNTLSYTGGPAFEIVSGHDSEINVLANFAGDVLDDGVYDTTEKPAIFTTTYGYGKVIAISPHPENSDNTKFLFLNLVEWGLDHTDYTPAKVQNVKVPKITRYKKKAYVKWDEISGATSYAVLVLNKKKTRTVKRYKNTTTNYRWAKKLKPGRTYNVRVRAKVTVGDTVFKGKWSKARQFTTKSQ